MLKNIVTIFSLIELDSIPHFIVLILQVLGGFNVILPDHIMFRHILLILLSFFDKLLLPFSSILLLKHLFLILLLYKILLFDFILRKMSMPRLKQPISFKFNRFGILDSFGILNCEFCDSGSHLL